MLSETWTPVVSRVRRRNNKIPKLTTTGVQAAAACLATVKIVGGISCWCFGCYVKNVRERSETRLAEYRRRRNRHATLLQSADKR